MRPASHVWDGFDVTQRDTAGKPRRATCRRCGVERAANSTKMAAHALRCASQPSDRDQPVEDDELESSQDSQASFAVSEDLLEDVRQDDNMSTISDAMASVGPSSSSSSSPTFPKRSVLACVSSVLFLPVLHRLGKRTLSEYLDRKWTEEDQQRAEKQQAFACVMAADPYNSVQKGPVTEFLKLLRKDFKPLTVYNLHKHIDAMAAEVDDQVHSHHVTFVLHTSLPSLRFVTPLAAANTDTWRWMAGLTLNTSPRWVTLQLLRPHPVSSGTCAELKAARRQSSWQPTSRTPR